MCRNKEDGVDNLAGASSPPHRLSRSWFVTSAHLTDNRAMFLPANSRRRTGLMLILLLAVLAFAKNDPQPPPKAFHAKTYPAVDTHSDEKVAIAADPYDMPDKTVFMLVPY